MSISNCGQLKAAIGDWLKRPDLSGILLDFIALAEARIARELRPSRQVVSASPRLAVAAGAAVVALPADWLESVRVRLVAPDRELVIVTAQEMAGRYRLSDRGSPQVFTVEGTSLRLGPTPDAAVEIDLLYHARLPALAADDSTTWLLQSHPGLYLWASLAEAAPFVLDDARAALWETKWQAEAQKFNQADDRAAHSGSVLRIRAR